MGYRIHFPQRKCLAHLLDLDPLPLGISYEHRAARHALFLLLVEVINDDSHEEVHNKEASDNHIAAEKENKTLSVVFDWLHVDSY